MQEKSEDNEEVVIASSAYVWREDVRALWWAHNLCSTISPWVSSVRQYTPGETGNDLDSGAA